MSLFPRTVQLVTLTAGPIFDAAGAPRQGVALVATLGTRVRILDSGSVLPSVVQALTDETGVATLELVATDSTGIDSTGWTYLIECEDTIVPGGVNVALPAASPAVRVEDLIGVTATDGSVVWLPANLADETVAELVGDTGSATYAAIVALGVGGGGVLTVNGQTGNVVLNAGDVAAEPAGSVAAHEGGTDVHTIAGTTGLQAALDGKAATGHNHDGDYEPAGAVAAHEAGTNVHTIAGTTGLQAALDGKVGGDGTITDVVAVTQAAYDLLSPPDPTTFYVIVG